MSVRAEAAVRAAPDGGVLLVTLSAMETSPGHAMADVARRARSLEAILDELDVPPADRSTSPIVLREEVDHTIDGRRPLGHRAASSVTIRLLDPELIRPRRAPTPRA